VQANEGTIVLSMERVLRAVRRQLRRSLKIDIIRSFNTSTLSHHLEEVFEAYRIDTIIDVGANEGQFGRLVRELGFTGDIHSFEPVKQTYDRLVRTAARDQRWTTHNLALGREAGTLSINVSEDSVFSSLLRPNDHGAGRFSGIKVQRQEQVEVATLDYFMRTHIGGARRRVFLKMDTQGYDIEVFAGAAASMDYFCCILSELSLIPIYDGMTDYLQTLATYQKHGFSVSGMYSVNRNDDLSLIEIDCVMVNRRRLGR
jgi:FkbM family methyltransferase